MYVTRKHGEPPLVETNIKNLLERVRITGFIRQYKNNLTVLDIYL